MTHRIRTRTGLVAALVTLLLLPALTMPALAADYGDSPVADALRRADTAVRRIIQIPDAERTFQNTVQAVDDLYANLELDTNFTMFMAHVSTDADERKAGRQAEKDVSAWLIELGKNEDLYRAVKAYADSAAASKLRGEDRRLLEHTMRDYRRAGMDLPAEKRDELKEIQKRISDLGVEFDLNINEDDTRVPLTREELSGMADDYFQQFGDDEIVGGNVFMVSMAYPHFLPVMDFCDNELTRKKMWIAYKRRAGKANIRLLEQILQLRAEAADILGYDHAADYEIEVRMAKDADTVMSFYEELRPKVRIKALKDREDLLDAKRRHTGNSRADLYPWDTSFYQKLLMKEKYAVDSDKVREYFPLDRCMDGLFGITQSLYGLEYRDVTERARARGKALWHEDVKLYEVWDVASGERLGEFYIDLHPRDNKYGHAAQWGLEQHKVWSDGRVNKPVAALVCNFPKPTEDRPSLLSHDQVETFFHEFGHCLHTILSEAEHWAFAGTGVERDFVEAPSQMFENWVWNADVLRTFARHYETGEPFPDELLEGMIEARYLGSGMLAERQFFYGLFDMQCHLRPDGDVNTTQLGYDLWDPDQWNVELYDPVPGTWFQAAFGHLTGYQAGYYGYQWSLVYACDMFDRFEELGMLSPSAGMYYRKKILARGGSVDGLELVRDYLGREPRMEPYLRHLGLEVEETAEAGQRGGGKGTE